MTILCIMCRPVRKRAGRPERGYAPLSGESKVVQTKRIRALFKIRGKNYTTDTIARVRECKKCRYRWKTREIVEQQRKSKK